MKRYTQREFDAIKREVAGYKVLAMGDWSDVEFGGEGQLIFADRCILGDGCRLGDWCILGAWCKLGDGCKLGGNCALGDACMLGNDCTLGDWCILGNLCTLGDGCVLGDACTLGGWCALGDECTLEGGAVEHAAFCKATNMGSFGEDAYAYCNTYTGAIFVRAGYWFSDIDAFTAHVHEVYGGTVYEDDYMAFADFARARFARYRKEENSNG